jgi:arylsulfatase
MRNLLLLPVLLIAACHTLRGAASPKRPNIVLIMADDMGWSDLGCYGSEIETPNIDSLARDGMQFLSFHNNAKCTTTRASILTGIYPRDAGGNLPQEVPTVAELLRERGYRTAFSGKWHQGSEAPNRPLDRGFESSYGLLDGCCNFFDPAQPDPGFKGGRVRVFCDGAERVTEFPGDYYTTDAFTERAVECIQEFAQEEAPFFLYLPYTAPHYPLHAREEDIAAQAGRYDDGWEAVAAARFQRQQQLGLFDEGAARAPLAREVSPWAETPHQEWQADLMEVYAAMVARMDYGVGEVLAALEEAGVAEDTLVLFLSDNGACAETPGGMDPTRIPGPKDDYTACGPGWAWAQNTPFRRYKQWVHQGGVATPLLARWPAGIEEGTRTSESGHIIDLIPTFLELAGEVDAPKHLEGESLSSVLRGSERLSPPEWGWLWAGNRAYRRNDWKISWDNKIKRWELYDMKLDPTESRDLSSEKSELVAELDAAWRAWKKRTRTKG